jgi:RNA polymerase sigma factor (sigma-70 family)
MPLPGEQIAAPAETRDVTERELLTRARAGDRQAQTTLYEHYIYNSPAIRGLLRRSADEEADREDLVQEIFLAVIQSKGEFRGDSRLSTYLFRIAQLTILEAHRADWTENPAQEPQSAPLEFAEVETRLALGRLLEKVPEAYREALRLRIVEDLDYQEIADRLAIPMNTVGTRIFKGKTILVNMLRESGFRVS